MNRQWLTAGAAGAASAVLFLSVTAGTLLAVVLTFLSPLPLFLAGLGLGWRIAAIAAAAATVVIGIAAGPLMAVNYLGVYGLTVTWLSRQALLSRTGPNGLEWYPPGYLLAWLSGLGALYLVVIMAFFAGIEGGLQGQAERGYLELVKNLTGGRLTDDMRLMAAEMAKWVGGIMVGTWMSMVTVNGILAQRLLARSARNLRPTPTLADVVLPTGLAVALGAALLATLLPDPVGSFGRAMTVALALPFVIQGLAVIHVLSRGWPARGPLLAVFYILVFAFFWLGLVAVAGIGLVEQWVQMRGRVTGADDGEEDE